MLLLWEKMYLPKSTRQIDRQTENLSPKLSMRNWACLFGWWKLFFYKKNNPILLTKSSHTHPSGKSVVFGCSVVQEEAMHVPFLWCWTSVVFNPQTFSTLGWVYKLVVVVLTGLYQDIVALVSIPISTLSMYLVHLDKPEKNIDYTLNNNLNVFTGNGLKYLHDM